MKDLVSEHRVGCVLKLKLRPAQERLLDRHLRHLTGVYNWAIRKIELDTKDGIYRSRYDIEALVNGHGPKIGVGQRFVSDTVRTAYRAWERCFSGAAQQPRLKGRRNRLNSIPFHAKPRHLERDRAFIPGFGPVRFHAQDVPCGTFSTGRIVKRASGWYLAVFLKAEPKAIAAGDGQIGIDPGFSHLLTFSDGTKIDHPRELEAGERRLAQAQRGHRGRLISRLHERNACRRHNRNHHLSRSIVEANRLIAFSADPHRAIARRFGKSVASSSHSQLRRFLDYKSRAGGGQYVEVSARNSTRTCSACGALTGPTGLAGLKVRQWVCSTCGVEHERDVNAAQNTLIAGRGMRHENGREAVPGIAI